MSVAPNPSQADADPDGLVYTNDDLIDIASPFNPFQLTHERDGRHGDTFWLYCTTTDEAIPFYWDELPKVAKALMVMYRRFGS